MDIKTILSQKVTSRQFRNHLIISAFIGVIWRLIWVNVWCSGTLKTPDYTWGYSGLASLISQGHLNALTNPGGQAVLPPLFSIYLGINDFFGITTPLGQADALCVLFFLGIIFSGLAARQIAGNRAGLITSWLVAISPNSWLYLSHLIAETLIIILVPAVIYTAYKWWFHPKITTGIVLGIAIGLATLDRTENVALIPFLVLPMVLLKKHFTLKLKLFDFSVITFATLMVLSPILYGNIVTYKYFDPLSAATGTFLLDSNCPVTYYTRDLGNVDTFCYSYYPFLTQGTFQNDQSTWDNSQTDYALRHIVYHYIWSNRNQVPNVVLARVLRTWHLVNPVNQNSWDPSEITTAWPLWIQTIAFISDYFLFGLLGVAIVSMRRKTIPYLPILIFPIITTLTIVLAGYLARYRISMEAALLIAGGIGIEALLSKKVSIIEPIAKIRKAFKDPSDTKLRSQVLTWIFWLTILISAVAYVNAVILTLPNG